MEYTLDQIQTKLEDACFSPEWIKNYSSNEEKLEEIIYLMTNLNIQYVSIFRLLAWIEAGSDPYEVIYHCQKK